MRKKTSKSSTQQKDLLVEAIDAILSGDDVEENDLSSSWIAVVDRGGLLHISDDLYRAFFAMELDISESRKSLKWFPLLKENSSLVCWQMRMFSFFGVLCVVRTAASSSLKLEIAVVMCTLLTHFILSAVAYKGTSRIIGLR